MDQRGPVLRPREAASSVPEIPLAPPGQIAQHSAIALTGYITIGGTTAVVRNVISANGGYGIYAFSEDGPQIIEGNDIGTDKTGTMALGNRSDGVYVYADTELTIGGTTPSARNIISGNDGSGVHFYSILMPETSWRATRSAPTPTAPSP